MAGFRCAYVGTDCASLHPVNREDPRLWIRAPQGCKFIYAMRDPRTQEIRYVGQSRGPLALRYLDHINSKSAGPKATWLKELRAIGLRPLFEHLDECVDKYADVIEQFWICFLRRHHRLTNHHGWYRWEGKEWPHGAVTRGR